MKDLLTYQDWDFQKKQEKYWREQQKYFQNEINKLFSD